MVHHEVTEDVRDRTWEARLSDRERLTGVLALHGLEARELPADTGTAELAARALGVTTKRIVKSLILVADGVPILVMAAGDRQVDLNDLARLLNIGELRMARAAEVKQVTGFSIGGVPPLGHSVPLASYLDRRLLEEEVVFGAAGSRFHVFGIESLRLKEIADATVVDLSDEGL